MFAYCYGRIFRTIRRQSKVVSNHVGESQDVAMTIKSRRQNAGQVQQQATGDTPGSKLSHTELNVLKTMITVVAGFIVCWSVSSVVTFLRVLQVSTLMCALLKRNNNYIISTI